LNEQYSFLYQLLEKILGEIDHRVAAYTDWITETIAANGGGL
jgi:hypothetical protein